MFVTGQVLAALAPAATEVSVRVAEQILADRAGLEKIWRLRLERAQIDVDRARRCYRLAEPGNRLVVRALEKDWEAALAAQQQLTEDWHRFCHSAPPALTTQHKAAITAAAADLPGLWTAPSTTDADRKEVIRAVIDEITIPLAPRTARTIDLAVGERARRPGVSGRRREAAGPARRRGGSSARPPPHRDQQGRHAPHAQTRLHHRRPRCRSPATRCPRGRIAR